VTLRHIACSCWRHKYQLHTDWTGIRVLKLRLITGTIMFVLLLFVSFKPSPYTGLGLFLVTALLSLRANREYFDLCGKAGLPGFCAISKIASLLMLGLAVLQARYDVSSLETAVIASTVLAVLVKGMRHDDHATGIRNAMVTLGGFLFFGWCLAFTMKIYFFSAAGVGPILLFFFLLVTKASDMGGYFFGKVTSTREGGNHKLVPRLSPGKSWEGLVGSLIFSGGLGGYLAFAFAETLTVNGIAIVTPLTGVIAGFSLALIGLAGDLVESVIKRAADTKDSGAIAPGMGGVYDVVDSVIFAAPLFYAWASRVL